MHKLIVFSLVSRKSEMARSVVVIQTEQNKTITIAAHYMICVGKHKNKTHSYNNFATQKK